MKYTVEVTAFAQADIDLAYGWLAVRTVHADVWLKGLQTQIEALSAFPTRCPLAPESREFREPVRQMLYGNSRMSTAFCSLFAKRLFMWCMSGTERATR